MYYRKVIEDKGAIHPDGAGYTDVKSVGIFHSSVFFKLEKSGGDYGLKLRVSERPFSFTASKFFIQTGLFGPIAFSLSPVPTFQLCTFRPAACLS